MPEDATPVLQAVWADLDAVVAADPIARDEESDRVDFLRSAIASGRCLVFVDADGLAGFVVTAPKHFFGRDFVELLMVHPDRRRCGVGRRLLRTAVSAASTNRVFASTNRSNIPMRHLLEREGWTFSGELRGLDEDDPARLLHPAHVTASTPAARSLGSNRVEGRARARSLNRGGVKSIPWRPRQDSNLRPTA